MIRINKNVFLYKLLKNIYIFCIKFVSSIVIVLARLFPLKKNLIVFESNPDLSDNSFAFFQYLCQHGYSQKYTIYWLIHDKRRLAGSRLNKINYFTGSSIIKKNFILQRAKYIIFDHTNIIGTHKREGQISLYLCHGTPIKGPKNDVKMGQTTWPNYLIGTSILSCEWTCKFWSTPQRIGLPLGYPRNDYLFEVSDIVKEKITKYLLLENFSKVILWMPTFRQSWDLFLSEDYLNNETGLPLISSINELRALNNYLNENNLLIILKLHPLQINLPAFNTNYSNLKIIRNSDLDKLDVQLYEFVTVSDALITDYSSISLDYLLLGRPIIFITCDFEQYKNNRGFIVDDVMRYLPGPHVNTTDEFKSAIYDIALNRDLYLEKRKEATNIFHNFKDGNSSKRIVEAIGL